MVKDSETKEKSAGSLIRVLLAFLDKHFAKFSGPVQNTIGIILIVVLAVYILNGFVAPTFVRGTLFLEESPSGGRRQVGGYTVMYKDAGMTTNMWGIWMLPVLRSGIPGRIKIKIF